MKSLKLKTEVSTYAIQQMQKKKKRKEEEY